MNLRAKVERLGTFQAQQRSAFRDESFIRTGERRVYRHTVRVKLHELATPELTMHGRQVLADVERGELESDMDWVFWDDGYFEGWNEASGETSPPAPLTFKVREVADLFPKRNNYAAGDAFMAIFGMFRAA